MHIRRGSEIVRDETDLFCAGGVAVEEFAGRGEGMYPDLAAELEGEVGKDCEC